MLQFSGKGKVNVGKKDVPFQKKVFKILIGLRTMKTH